jgi:hypothetical protein
VLPPLSGRPIRVELRPSLGPHLAATSIPRRLILLDAELLRTSDDFDRILVHEIFHFAWLRLSNQSRRGWEAVLQSELNPRAAGDLARGEPGRGEPGRGELGDGGLGWGEPGRGKLGKGELGGGELGWSAEWRKQKLTRADRTRRSPAWRRYACESFCDSAAWLYAGLRHHDEFTLAPLYRRRRRVWFQRQFPPATPILI